MPSCFGTATRSTVTQRAVSWWRRRHGFEHRAGGLGLQPRDQQAVRATEQRLGNGHDLGGALTLPQDDFRHPIPERAVMVDLREADIFVGQALKLPYGSINLRTPFGDGYEQLTESVLLDDVPPRGSECFMITLADLTIAGIRLPRAQLDSREVLCAACGLAAPMPSS
jgi:hypothetical protein